MPKILYIKGSSLKTFSTSLKGLQLLTLSCICIVMSMSNVVSQDFKFGTPKIYNHSKDAYHAGPQNWSASYSNGNIFFANNGGLLSFDGISWRSFPTPGNTIMRSIAISPSKRIYIGAQNELGYFYPNSSGGLAYENLRDKFRSQLSDLAEVWHLLIENENLAFSSNDKIYLIRNDSISTFGKNAYIYSFAKIQNSFWYHSEGQAIFQIVKGKESIIPTSETFKDKKIIKIVPDQTNDRVFLLTEKKGIYIYKDGKCTEWINNAQHFLKEKRISSAIYHSKHGLIVGTYLGGLVVINDLGQTTLALNKKNGLQNNAINTLTYAPNDVLWLGTNNGIDEIDFSSLSRKFFPDNELEGAVYDVEIWKGKYYFSTSHGLYSINEKEYYNPLTDYNFELVPGTKGQTWGTDIINDQLYCAHHEGPLKIDELAESIPGTFSAWKFLALNKNTLVLGNYNGLALYSIKQNGDLEFIRMVRGMDESARIMLLDKFDNLWVSHPYKKVYRIKFNQDLSSETVQEYTMEDGFAANDRNYVFNINGICYLTNETGIYKYNEKNDRFEKDNILNKYFESSNHVRRLIQNNNDIWCISDRNSICLTLENNGLDNEISQKKLENLNTDATYIGGFEELFPIADNSLIISTEDGAIEYDLKAKPNNNLDVAIKSIALPLQKDSLVFSSIGKNKKEINLKASENAVRISFQTNYPNTNNYHEYSYKLSGNDQKWSSWTSNTTKEYNNLSSGDHSFEIKGRTVSLLESPVNKINFSIQAPWYKKPWLKLFIF